MPISISLPAPSIEFYSDLMYPYMIVNSQRQTRVDPGNDVVRCRLRAQQGVVTVAPVIVAGGAGVTPPEGSVLGGRYAALTQTTIARTSAGFRPDTWSPAWDAAEFNAGALLNPPSVVAIWDFHVALLATAFVAGTADETGFGFQPRIPVQPSLSDGTFGGLAPVGGFAVYANDDGGGNAIWEFVSYDAVPAVLQRTTISAAIVPDVTDWTSIRFTIIGAGPSRPATLSLAVNGTSVPGVQGLPFDDVTIMRPNTLNATAAGFLAAHTVGPPAAGTAGYNFQLFARFGRFTSGGEEIQGV